MELTVAHGVRNARWELYERALGLTSAHPRLTKLAGALLLASLTALSAQVELRTPLTPVPFTLQLLPVLLSGALLGRAWGALSQELYLAAGMLGVPVFAGGAAGLGVFTNALSAGYLIGYVPAAYLVGWVAESRTVRPRRSLLLLSAAGLAILVTLALLNAYLLLETSAPSAAAWGLVLAGELVLLSFILYAALRRRRQRERTELLFGMILALFVVHLFGALWFALLSSALDGPGSLPRLLQLTLVPFIPWDLLKVALAVGALTAVRPTRREVALRAAAEAVRV